MADRIGPGLSLLIVAGIWFKYFEEQNRSNLEIIAAGFMGTVAQLSDDLEPITDIEWIDKLEGVARIIIPTWDRQERWAAYRRTPGSLPI